MALGSHCTVPHGEEARLQKTRCEVGRPQPNTGSKWYIYVIWGSERNRRTLKIIQGEFTHTGTIWNLGLGKGWDGSTTKFMCTEGCEQHRPLLCRPKGAGKGPLPEAGKSIVSRRNSGFDSHLEVNSGL